MAGLNCWACYAIILDHKKKNSKLLRRPYYLPHAGYHVNLSNAMICIFTWPEFKDLPEMFLGIKMQNIYRKLKSILFPIKVYTISIPLMVCI